MRGRGGFRGMPKAPTGPMNAPPEEAEAHSKVSKRENRLYVGNLAYDVSYKDLADFMSGGGCFGLPVRLGGMQVGEVSGCWRLSFDRLPAIS